MIEWSEIEKTSRLSWCEPEAKRSFRMSRAVCQVAHAAPVGVVYPTKPSHEQCDGDNDDP
jgi:hypothetical protein